MTTHSSSPSTAAKPKTLPPGYEDFAGEIQVANGKPPAWMKYFPYVVTVLGLGYYVYVRATDPVNLVFAGVLLFWLIYTPVAQKRGWFFIPM